MEEWTFYTKVLDICYYITIKSEKIIIKTLKYINDN